MRKNHLKAIKNGHSVSDKTARVETPIPYKEKPLKNVEGLAAHDLFSLFTADIIQENVTFTR